MKLGACKVFILSSGSSVSKFPQFTVEVGVIASVVVVRVRMIVYSTLGVVASGKKFDLGVKFELVRVLRCVEVTPGLSELRANDGLPKVLGTLRVIELLPLELLMTFGRSLCSGSSMGLT